ncbi:hypothetical protein E3N88_15113 [Mikania micrantha]|uniref:Uncharacterized protein n=1 Tax=Mikania micrantha TaxID=192012 RepID=A0A5N6NWT1_9ASTR|nr:hypothetical protein E3N88_15113 [Mikania micrantha]
MVCCRCLLSVLCRFGTAAAVMFLPFVCFVDLALLLYYISSPLPDSTKSGIFTGIVIGLRVKFGPYLGGATRKVCSVQLMLQPWRFPKIYANVAKFGKKGKPVSGTYIEQEEIRVYADQERGQQPTPEQWVYNESSEIGVPLCIRYDAAVVDAENPGGWEQIGPVFKENCISWYQSAVDNQWQVVLIPGGIPVEAPTEATRMKAEIPSTLQRLLGSNNEYETWRLNGKNATKKPKPIPSSGTTVKVRVILLGGGDNTDGILGMILYVAWALRWRFLKFDGRVQPDDFLDWLSTVERIFDLENIPDPYKVKLVAIKLWKSASLWWIT